MDNIYVLKIEIVEKEYEHGEIVSSTILLFKSKEKAIEHVNYLVSCDKSASNFLDAGEYDNTFKITYFTNNEERPRFKKRYLIKEYPVIE